MKDTKTVLPTTGNGENKNGFRHKHKTNQENGNDEHKTTTTTKSLDNEELIGGCCVCSDDQGFANNALVYCDGKGCTVACHTACYGIVSIPDGDWYCGRCEAGDDIRAPCRLCPTIEGAMKRTSDGGWAHVVCALYIPEVSFGDDETMEPILLSKIPSTRFGQECSICIQNGRSKTIARSGACCECTVKNCSQVFHVTCAQANGLLCEDVRKNNCLYPIYCEQHRPKLSKFIRQIPSFQYSPKALASPEQLSKQHLQHSKEKEKESPSQLSDFVAAVAAEAAASETDVPSSSILDETNNQTTTSDEQQTPVSRAFYSADILQRKSSSNTNSSLSSSSTSVSPIVQQKSHSRSSSSSSSNCSLQKKVKSNDEINNNRSLTDLSQFVQLNKEERSFLPPPPPPPPNQLNEKEATIKNDSSTIESKEPINDSSKSTKPVPDSQTSLSSIEEKSLASRCTISTSNDNKSPIKQRHSTDGPSTNIKSSLFKKTFPPKIKDEDHDEDYQLNKKRKLSIKLNKDGQPRKKRQHSTDGAPRPVGRPPSKKTIVAQQLTNGLKRPFSKPTTNNMKQQKGNDTFITMQQNPSENENDNETILNSRSTHYHPCDHFGNQINSDVFKQHGHSDEQLQQISPPTNSNEEISRSRVPSSSITPRIDFYPRRPLQHTSTTIDQPQPSRTFPPQTLEEFLEQEWELSSDFLLQQTMPHDVSSLLSCLYQFKSENAALQKKFDELKHRRDSLRVTNANLRRRLSEILPINDTLPPPPPPLLPSTTTTTVTQVSPPPPPPSIVLPVVPPSPRKEQQQLKQQKLLAELELQQQLQQQKAISPSRRRLSTNQYTDSCHQTIKKSKSPRQLNTLSHQSILESQLRQSTNNNSIKKLNHNLPNNKKVIASDMELVSHHSSTNSSALPPTGESSSSSYEQIDVAATAAAAYAMAKNGRATSNPGLNLELLSQILAASGNAISPQLFVPTWNISNFGYVNFPGTNPLSSTDESILRSYVPPLEQQQPSTKQQP